MKHLLILAAIVLASATATFGQKKMHKLSKEEQAKMTQDQRIAYENDRHAKKHKKKKKKDDSVKKKARRAKKQDRQARRIKNPK